MHCLLETCALPLCFFSFCKIHVHGPDSLVKSLTRPLRSFKILQDNESKVVPDIIYQVESRSCGMLKKKRTDLHYMSVCGNM